MPYPVLLAITIALETPIRALAGDLQSRLLILAVRRESIKQQILLACIVPQENSALETASSTFAIPTMALRGHLAVPALKENFPKTYTWVSA